MARLLKKTQRLINDLPERLKLFKLVYSEKKAIHGKRRLYEHIQWSKEEADQMEAYWLKHYGIAISSKWHRLYQSMNGKFKVDYFPEMLYTTELERTLNPPQFCAYYTDKSLLEFIFSGVPNVRIPRTILVSCNGHLLDHDRNFVKIDEFEKSYGNIGKCILKPTIETGSGIGVKLLNIQDSFDLESGKSLKDILAESGENYIIQEKINCNVPLRKLNPNAVNTIRLTTYIYENEIHHVPLALRIGTGRSHLDNIHAGGIGVGINPDGTLKKLAYDLGYGNKVITFEKHPGTGVVFENYYIGNMPAVVETAKALHQRAAYVGIISWDFTIDENNRIVLIEANCLDQGSWFPQIINQESLFGEDTPYMLKKIYKKRKI